MADPYLHDPYLQENGVLRNLFGETDSGRLAVLEGDESDARAIELHVERLPLLGVSVAFGAEHIRAIHRHLFQDVYLWAGEFRTVGISKGLDSAFAPPFLIRDLVDELEVKIRDHGAAAMAADATAFLVQVLADLNYAHPFREGNGRTQRIFAGQYAAEHGIDLDWSLVTADENNTAFAEAMNGRRGALTELVSRIQVPTP